MSKLVHVLTNTCLYVLIHFHTNTCQNWYISKSRYVLTKTWFYNIIFYIILHTKKRLLRKTGRLQNAEVSSVFCYNKVTARCVFCSKNYVCSKNSCPPPCGRMILLRSRKIWKRWKKSRYHQFVYPNGTYQVKMHELIQLLSVAKISKQKFCFSFLLVLKKRTFWVRFSIVLEI